MLTCLNAYMLTCLLAYMLTHSRGPITNGKSTQRRSLRTLPASTVYMYLYLLISFWRRALRKSRCFSRVSRLIAWWLPGWIEIVPGSSREALPTFTSYYGVVCDDNIHAYMRTRLHAYLPTCQPACTLTCLLACICLHSYTPACLNV